MTATGTVLGTAGYLAPEQALGQPAGPRSDLYSLGVVGYELLTGDRRFERGSDTAEAAAHINEPVPPASERRAGLPSAVDRIFERALAKHPRTRYASGPISWAPLATLCPAARPRLECCPPRYPPHPLRLRFGGRRPHRSAGVRRR